MKLSCSLEGCHCGQLSFVHCLPPEHHEGIHSPLQVLWGHMRPLNVTLAQHARYRDKPGTSDSRMRQV